MPAPSAAEAGMARASSKVVVMLGQASVLRWVEETVRLSKYRCGSLVDHKIGCGSWIAGYESQASDV